jgi:hypothetical protein
MLVELHLYDVVEAAIDGSEALAHLVAKIGDVSRHFFAKASDLFVHIAADILAFFFDETRKLLEL